MKLLLIAIFFLPVFAQQRTGQSPPFLCSSTNGSATAYTCPATTVVSQCFTDMVVIWKPSITSGASPTLNVGCGAKAIKTNENTVPASGLFTAGYPVMLRYDGTAWRATPIISSANGGVGTGSLNLTGVALPTNAPAGTVRGSVVQGTSSPINVAFYGVVGDSVTANDTNIATAVAAAIAGGRSLYFPAATGCYKITGPISVIGDVAIYGDSMANPISKSASTICTTDSTQDILQITSPLGATRIEKLSFMHLAGIATGASAATSTTITVTGGSDITMSTITAASLSLGLTVYKYRIYANAGKLYRVTSPVGGTVIPNPTGTLPTHSSGDVVLNGITWQYFGSGSTYTRGQFAMGAQWWFHGISGSQLLDVTTSDSSSSATPNNYDGAGHSITSITNAPYFVSLQYLANTGSNVSAAIHLITAQDPSISNIYCIQSPGSCVLRNSGVQGGFMEAIEVDGGYIGISGDLTNSMIRGNRLYGMTAAAIKSSKGYAPKLIGNYFHDGAGILLDSAYVPAGGGSDIQFVEVIGNTFQNATWALKSTGVYGMIFTGNTVSRTGDANVISMANVDGSSVEGNKFFGAGELVGGVGNSYFKFTGAVTNNSFSNNSFLRINGGELATTVWGWSTVPTQEKLNFFRANNYDSAYIVSTGSSSKTTDRNLLTSPNQSRVIVTETLTPGISSQVFTYTGNLPASTIVTLARTGTIAGDWFLLRVLVNPGGNTLTFKQESDASTILAFTDPFTLDRSILFAYDGSNWYVVNNRDEHVVIGGSQSAGGQSSHFSLVTGNGATTSNRLVFGVLDGSYSWIQATQPGTANRQLVLNSSGGNVTVGTTADNGTDTLQVGGSIKATRSQVTATTVASLGACGATQRGIRAAVTDALAPSIGSAVVGGGAASAQVWCNSANWTVTGI